MVSRLLLALLFIVAVTLGAFWFAGPREPVDLTVHFDPAAIGDDVDAYLARTEADIPNLRPNAAKEVVWAYPASRARTPLAIVYIHGFAAAKGEVRPLVDHIAADLGANLYYTRLTGHGRDGAAMEQASVNDWLNDLAEAVAIGRAIGNDVIVIGTSTGGTLSVLGATIPGLMEGVDGLVLLSPNFGLQTRWAPLLEAPFARELLPRLYGDTFQFKPGNALQAENWTTSFPTAALAPMAALVRAVRHADLSDVQIPVLALYSPNDQIVDPDATRRAISHRGGPHRAETVPTDDPAGHTLAGDAFSPGTTNALAERIETWIRKLEDGR